MMAHSNKFSLHALRSDLDPVDLKTSHGISQRTALCAASRSICRLRKMRFLNMPCHVLGVHAPGLIARMPAGGWSAGHRAAV